MKLKFVVHIFLSLWLISILTGLKEIYFLTAKQTPFIEIIKIPNRRLSMPGSPF